MKLVLGGAEHKKQHDILVSQEAPCVSFNYRKLRSRKDAGYGLVEAAKQAGQWVLIRSGEYADRRKYRLFAKQNRKDGEVRRELSGKWERKARSDAGGVSKEVVKQHIEVETKKYCDWLEKLPCTVDAVGSYAVDCFVDEAHIEAIRESVGEAADSAEADMIVTPTPKITSTDAWASLIEKYSYIGLAGSMKPEEAAAWFGSMSQHLRSSQTVVHGWGFTDKVSITSIPFYSVNSSTWVKGGQYGTTYEYVGLYRMRTHDTAKEEREAFRETLVKKYSPTTVDTDAFIEDDVKATHQWNAWHWSRLAKDLDTRTTQAYWLSDEEKQDKIRLARERENVPTAITRQKGREPVETSSLYSYTGSNRMCDTCALNQFCPEYEPGAECSITAMPDVEGPEDVKKVMNIMLSVQFERAMFAAHSERSRGVAGDETAQKEMDLTSRIAKIADQVGRDEIEFTAKASGHGILTQLTQGLRGGKADEEKDEPTVIDVDEQ